MRCKVPPKEEGFGEDMGDGGFGGGGFDSGAGGQAAPPASGDVDAAIAATDSGEW